MLTQVLLSNQKLLTEYLISFWSHILLPKEQSSQLTFTLLQTPPKLRKRPFLISPMLFATIITIGQTQLKFQLLACWQIKLQFTEVKSEISLQILISTDSHSIFEIIYSFFAFYEIILYLIYVTIIKTLSFYIKYLSKN